MNITPEEIARMARLARLRLAPEEERAISSELAGILRHVDALKAADDGEGETGLGASPGATPLREDASVPDGMVRAPAAAAPAWEAPFFVVPRPGPPGDETGPDDGAA